MQKSTINNEYHMRKWLFDRLILSHHSKIGPLIDHQFYANCLIIISNQSMCVCVCVPHRCCGRRCPSDISDSKMIRVGCESETLFLFIGFLILSVSAIGELRPANARETANRSGEKPKTIK